MTLLSANPQQGTASTRHVFHRACIQRWIDKNPNCPTCRTHCDIERRERNTCTEHCEIEQPERGFCDIIGDLGIFFGTGNHHRLPMGEQLAKALLTSPSALYYILPAVHGANFATAGLAANTTAHHLPYPPKAYAEATTCGTEMGILGNISLFTLASLYENTLDNPETRRRLQALEQDARNMLNLDS